jgi:hypothetical protein
MDGLSQCDILTHCNFGQPMAVTSDFDFCWVFHLSRDFTMRFLAFEGTVAGDFLTLLGM